MTGKRRKAKFVQIGSVLDTVLKKYRRDTDARLIRVCQIWDSVVGDVIAQNTRPSAVKGRVLLIHVTSSTWVHQLQFLKADIIDKLNQALNPQQIEDLKFKIGPVEIEE